MKTLYYVLGAMVFGLVSYKVYEYYFYEKEPTIEDKKNMKINFVRK